MVSSTGILRNLAISNGIPRYLAAKKHTNFRPRAGSPVLIGRRQPHTHDWLGLGEFKGLQIADLLFRSRISLTGTNGALAMARGPHSLLFQSL